MGLNDPAVMFDDLRLNKLPKMRFQALVRPLFVRAHQPRVPGYVGGEDRGEAADGRHFLSGGRLA